MVYDAGNVECMEFWSASAPIVYAMSATYSSVFVCQNFTCQKPSSDVEEVRRMLQLGPTKTSPKAIDLNGSMLKCATML